MRLNVWLAAAAVAGCIVSSPAIAADAPASTPTPAPKWTELVTVQGLADGNYSYRFNGAPRSPSEIRVFSFNDVNDSFMLNYAEISAQIAPAPVGFRLDLGFGRV